MARDSTRSISETKLKSKMIKRAKTRKGFRKAGGAKLFRRSGYFGEANTFALSCNFASFPTRNVFCGIVLGNLGVITLRTIGGLLST